MRRKNDGKESEKLLDQYLKSTMSLDKDIVFYKFVDSSAARNLINNQPADRLLIYKGKPILVEIKSSIDPDRFPLKNISKKQIGAARRWNLAGAKSMFIIHRKPTDEWYFLCLKTVWEKYESGKKSWLWSELEDKKQVMGFPFWKHVC